jgi:hypothetical protein
MRQSKEARNRDLKLAKFVVRPQVEVDHTLMINNLIISRKGKWIGEEIGEEIGEWDFAGFQDG